MRTIPKTRLLPVLLSVGLFMTGTTAFATTVDVSQNGNQFDFTTNLSSLANLSDEDISSTITADTFVPSTPTEDEGGFPLGSPASSYSYIELPSLDVIVSTNSSGQLTALTMSGVYFASFPAFSGENPTDFYCTYNAPGGSLITDNDVGFCPATANTNVDFGTQGPPSTTPEPASFWLLSGGVSLLLPLGWRRNRLGARSR